MPNMPQSSPALLIDLDGTLVDTVADLAAALNALLAERGLPPLAEAAVRGLVGRGARRLVERGLSSAGAPPDDAALDAAHARFLELYGAAPAARSRPYPGVRATLAAWQAAGVPMAVCTNKPQAPSLAILRALGLDGHFRAVGGGDRYPVRKPDGGHLTATLAEAGLAGRPAVMIGDSAPDLEAARDAGLPVVLVDYGYSGRPVAELGADAVVSRFDALPAVVTRLAGTAQAPGAAAS
jgi:phosphoglycolate phosphatase